ncbi:MAG: PAS domain S-box protein [Proteobacteria bacterium]|nr:PAS domain S-box protein [Pseudomonadota bacterium]
MKEAMREQVNAQRYLDIAGVIFVVINTKQKVTLINKKGGEVLGYTEKEILGKNWFDNFIPQSKRDEVRAIFNNLMAGVIEPYEYSENPVLTKSGEERIIAWHNTVITDDTGTIIETLSSGEDITERKQAEEELRESVERFRTIMEYANDAIFFVDSRGNIRFWNRKAEELYGYTVEEVLGKPQSVLVPKRLQEIHSKWMDKFLSLDESAISGKIVEGIGERKDGSEFYAEISTVLLKQRGERYLVGILRDITERKKAEKLLREAEERYRTVVENTGQIIYDYDVASGRIQWCGAIQAITGFTPEAFQNIDINAWGGNIHPDDRKSSRILLDQAMRDRIPYDAGYRFGRFNGTYCYIEDRGLFLYDENGKAYRMLGTLRDVTERKQMEEEIRALSLTDELTGLYNRRGFLTLADQQFKVAARWQSDIPLIFADLDGMKWINDNLGHLVGDQALIETATILKNTFRKSDIIARIGGDEFVTLALGVTDTTSLTIINRIQEEIKSLNIQKNRSFKLSISTGIAYFDPQFPCSVDELIAQADKSMYKHKQSKRGFSI